MNSQVAIYCRLSKEDDDHSRESESIQNQKSLLIKYAVEKGWDVYSIYSDEDYSGVDRERPEFNNLIADAGQGKFNIILCKTQSRFTRDMELVEKYIHHEFLLWGIRFVAVVDNIDTDIKGNKKARQINGLINEWYLEDLSENIRAVFNHKRRNGQYIGGFPIYGYKKNPNDKNKLLIDFESAEVVRKIYRLYLDGNGKQHIARILNDESVPNPTKYKQLKGLGYVNGLQKNDFGLWNRTSVGRILRNQMYTGDMVQGCRKKVSYKSKMLVGVPKDEWIVVENTHEAIIDKETFEVVQKLLCERTTSGGTGEVHLLAGKVKCLDCGSSMIKTSNGCEGSSRRSYLRCKLYATDSRRCESHSIRLDLLEEQVSELLRGHIEHYYDAGNAANLFDVEKEKHRKAEIHKQIKTLQFEIDRRSKVLKDLYLDKSSGLIPENQFAELNKSYLAEKTALEKRIILLKAQTDDIQDEKKSEETIKKKIHEWLNFETLSRELIADFVESIEIGQKSKETKGQEIKINWAF